MTLRAVVSRFFLFAQDFLLTASEAGACTFTGPSTGVIGKNINLRKTAVQFCFPHENNFIKRNMQKPKKSL